MKQLSIFVLLSAVLIFLFVCCEDKSTNPPPPTDPRHYFPLNKDYGWRYIELYGPECDEIRDSFDLIILGTKVRHNDVGFDRLRKDINDTNFIYPRRDTLFLEKVWGGVPDLKILVGPIQAGTIWNDQNFNYFIQGMEPCTLTINDGQIYKGCAKILKTNRYNPTTRNRVYEWWAPQHGEVKEIEVDTLGICRYAKELRYMTQSGEFP